MYNENVLVVPEKYLNYDIFFNGWSDVNKVGQCHLNELLTHSLFLDRNKAEDDPSFKQIIPYCVVKNKAGQVLTYQRNKKGGESRLHAKYSLGWGGHCNDTKVTFPKDGKTSYEECIYRELEEELGLDVYQYKYNCELLGFIYDDGNFVGKVHYGLVNEISPSTQDFDLDKFKIEDTIGECRFENPENLETQIDKFEGWSQILIKNKVLLG